jgi:heterodisulfide reductase subunit C
MVTDMFTPLRLDRTDNRLEQEVKELLGIDVNTCMECGKCTGGCSNGHLFDFTPRKIVQLVKLGAEQTLMNMDALWICLSCHLCIDRCPSGIDIPRILDYFREKARRSGIPATRQAVSLFHELMLEQIRNRGRVSEVALMMRFNSATGRLTKDAGIGLKMFLKGMLNPFPSSVRDRKAVRRLYEIIAGSGKS